MRVRAAVIGVVLVASAFAGCMEGEGSASVYVRDAPTDEFQEIHIVFEDAYVHEDGDEDENGTDEADGGDGGPSNQGGPSEGEMQTMGGHGGQGGQQNQFSEDAGWIPIAEDENPIDVNLLNATGAQAAFLGEANLSAGQYTQIAIVVDDAYGIDDEGERVDVTVPSGVGRIVESFEVASGEETRIVLDLDLDRAMTEANGDWKLTPVFGKTVVEQVDDGESGADQHERGEIADVGEGGS
jgi:hypothetical protein